MRPLLGPLQIPSKPLITTNSQEAELLQKRMLPLACLIGTLLFGAACSSERAPEPVNPSVGESSQPASTTPNAKSFTTFGDTTFSASQASLGSQQSGIWVHGLGSVTVIPDIALLELGVEAKSTTVAAARDQAAQAMESIKTVLADMGIDSPDIATRFFNIQPEYTYNERARRQEITGYRVTNTLSVKVRTLESIGTLIDKAVFAGGDLTRINNVRFTVEDPSPYSTQARQVAVEDAIEKAQQFARLTQVSLGKLVYIAEADTNVPTVKNFAMESRMLSQATGAPATTVSPGEMDITVTVQAVFNIG